jgi:hypothetical protein
MEAGAGGVGKHIQHIVGGEARVVGRFMDAMLLPVGLPPWFFLRKRVFAHRFLYRCAKIGVCTLCFSPVFPNFGDVRLSGRIFFLILDAVSDRDLCGTGCFLNLLG